MNSTIRWVLFYFWVPKQKLFTCVAIAVSLVIVFTGFHELVDVVTVATHYAIYSYAITNPDQLAPKLNVFIAN